jgi:hypothetical protein
MPPNLKNIKILKIENYIFGTTFLGYGPILGYGAILENLLWHGP